MNGLTAPQRPVACAADEPGAGPPLDEALILYIQRTQPAFDLLRQVEGQFAGLLALAAAGSKAAAANHPIQATAREAFAEASERLREIAPPSGGRHHYHHLSEARKLIGQALEHAEAALRARSDPKSNLDAAFEPLQLAHRHLQWAAFALPGFEMVAFSQGCCAAHGLRRAPYAPIASGRN